ncbi:hypothetical protein CYMTET_12232 [Cymbomonas tetramitiformis]|uniref:PHD-type domain-containing protein n=1 Tax=Cymbomonas tetramitiformis TaxID=36881 RepID=A0AAE0LC98_9CHLO|nr:hypothetical protein CYMTET_12232 [Cymbomonas tetramitiformis]
MRQVEPSRELAIQWNHAPWLCRDDGELRTTPFRVHFILEGYLQQLRKLNLPPTHPRWTDFKMRNNMEQSMFVGTRESKFASGAGMCLKSAPVSNWIERCTVTEMKFYQTQEESKMQTFVQLTLMHSPISNSVRLRGQLSVDVYANADCSDFILPGEYAEPEDYAERLREWKKDDRFQMNFRDPELPGTVGIWPGTIVGHRPKREEDEGFIFYDSLFETMVVKWDDTQEEDCICVWDIMRPSSHNRAQYNRELRTTHPILDLELDSDDDNPLGFLSSDDNANDSDDEDYTEHRASHRGSRRRDPGAQRCQRPDVPITMERSSRQFKVDWNSYYCGKCWEGGDVIECDGSCLRSFHVECLPEAARPKEEDGDADWFCPQCRQGKAWCAACGREGDVGKDMFKCIKGSCSNSYHVDCLRVLPRTKYTVDGDASRPFCCPTHFCAACNISGDALKMLKCWHCVSAWHVNCLPVGSQTMQENPKDCVCRECSLWSTSVRDVGVRAGSAGAASSSAASLLITGAESSTVPFPSRSHKRPLVSDGRLLVEDAGPSTLVWDARIVVLNADGTRGPVTDLQGQQIFTFGPHKKGGGCTWFAPATGCKIHTKIHVVRDEADARSRPTAFLESVHALKADVIPTMLNNEPLRDKSRHPLENECREKRRACNAQNRRKKAKQRRHA